MRAGDRRGRVATTALAAAAALASAAVFLGTLDAGFVNFDDDIYITRNPLVKAGTWKSVAGLLTRRQLGVYNPLPLLVFSAQYAWWGDRAAGYHATNVLFHAANTVLVFALVFSLSRRRFVAFACALLWGVHPLRVESVAWVSQLKEMLGAFFFLAALHLYVARTRSRRAYGLAVVSFVCSVACKPIYVTLPAVVLLIELCRERRLSRGAWVRVIPFAVVAAGWAALSLVLVGEASGWIFVRTVPQRIAAAVYLLAFYPRKVFWPGELSVTYSVPLISLGSMEFALSAVAAAALLAVGVLTFRRTTLPLFAVGFYVITLSPMLGLALYPGEICSDRYTYLASVGVVLLPALALEWLLRRVRAGVGWGYVAALAAALPLATLSIARAEDWSDGLALWQSQLRAKPHSFLAHNNLGSAYERRGQLEPALYHFHAAGRLAPGQAPPKNNIARVHFARGEFRRAAHWFRAVAALRPDDPGVWTNLGNAELNAGDPDAAVESLRTAVATRGDDAAILTLLGKALTAAGHAVEAAVTYEKALELEPGLYFVHVALGDLHAGRGEGARAAAHYRAGLRLAPPDFDERPRVRRRLADLEQRGSP